MVAQVQGAAYEVSVVAPCYNEAHNLEELVARLQAAFASGAFSGQIVLVGDVHRHRTILRVVDPLLRPEQAALQS